jgi:UDP-N-acetylmuramyl pentapeptide phosphotransferase/UDP-N-acetylglucosamine-1-phosphate transferase
MIFVAAVLIGGVVGSTGWQALKGSLGSSLFARTNYRDHRLITGSGLVIVIGAWAIAAAAALIGPLELVGARTSLLMIVTGFGVVGLLDDLAGEGQSGGFRGHLRSLRHGQVTTGILKLVGGPLVAIAALADSRPEPLELLRGAAIVALAANLMNLFDRGPGRVIKVSGVALAGLVAAALVRYSDLGFLAPIGAVIGIGMGLSGVDLKEEAMLGDVGSNALGAALGVGALAVSEPSAEWVILEVLLVANLLSERWSFSAIIDSVGPLRWLDRLGTTPERREFR